MQVTSRNQAEGLYLQWLSHTGFWIKSSHCKIPAIGNSCKNHCKTSGNHGKKQNNLLSLRGWQSDSSMTSDDDRWWIMVSTYSQKKQLKLIRGFRASETNFSDSPENSYYRNLRSQIHAFKYRLTACPSQVNKRYGHHHTQAISFSTRPPPPVLKESESVNLKSVWKNHL